MSEIKCFSSEASNRRLDSEIELADFRKAELLNALDRLDDELEKLEQVHAYCVREAMNIRKLLR